jgi:hypothetical protein
MAGTATVTLFSSGRRALQVWSLKVSLGVELSKSQQGSVKHPGGAHFDLQVSGWILSSEICVTSCW